MSPISCCSPTGHIVIAASLSPRRGHWATENLRYHHAAGSENEIVGSSQAGPVQQQSGRRFTSASSTTRAKDAAFQVTRISSSLPVHSRHCAQHFQRPAPSHIPRYAPRPQRRGVPDVASCYRGLNLSWAFPTSRRTDSSCCDSTSKNPFYAKTPQNPRDADGGHKL
jgi:hypothetical protein